MDCIHLACEWQAVIDTVMNLRVPLKAGNILRNTVNRQEVFCSMQLYCNPEWTDLVYTQSERLLGVGLASWFNILHTKPQFYVLLLSETAQLVILPLFDKLSWYADGLH